MAPKPGFVIARSATDLGGSHAADGNWIGDYIPAAVRAYPFRMVKPQDRDEKVLCFDNSEGLLCDVGQGEPFFDGDVLGKATQEMLNLLSEAERQAGF